MCTALIMGIAQLGLGLASSYSQYQTQKKQSNIQENQIKEQKQQTQQVQEAETVQSDRKARADAAQMRAASGASGTELTGSKADGLNQIGQDYQLGQKVVDLQNQNQLAQKDYQIAQINNKAQQSQNMFGYNIASQILNGAGKMI